MQSPPPSLLAASSLLHSCICLSLERCVGAVVVSMIDHPQQYGDNNGAHAGGGGGGGGSRKLLVPVVLEALPESCLGVPRKVDLGAVALDSITTSSFEVENISAGPAPLRWVLRCGGV